MLCDRQPCLEVYILGIVLSHTVDNLNVNNSLCMLKFEFHLVEVFRLEQMNYFFHVML